MVCLARAVERFIVLRRHESMLVLEVSGVAMSVSISHSWCCRMPTYSTQPGIFIADAVELPVKSAVWS